VFFTTKRDPHFLACLFRPPFRGFHFPPFCFPFLAPSAAVIQLRLAVPQKNLVPPALSVPGSRYLDVSNTEVTYPPKESSSSFLSSLSFRFSSFYLSGGFWAGLFAPFFFFDRPPFKKDRLFKHICLLRWLLLDLFFQSRPFAFLYVEPLGSLIPRAFFLLAVSFAFFRFESLLCRLGES